ncbi:MAG: universal stress protein [Gemmatimonadota bacterium]
MHTFPHILVPIDFSPSTVPLLRCLAELRALGAERVTLLYVMPVRYPRAAPPPEHHTLYESLLDERAGQLRADGFEVETRLVLGDPATEIVEAGRAADLILIGSRGHNLLYRLLIGSTAAEVVRTAETPVLLDRIEPGEEADCTAVCAAKVRRVLLATDGSASAHAAERVALALADGAEHLVLVTVLDEGSDNEEAARTHLDHLADGYRGSVAIHVERGEKASEVIRRLADAEDATLVVVGRQGRGYLTGNMLGSTAEAVVVRSGRPVLLVPSTR